jgi:hypothetical protein
MKHLTMEELEAGLALIRRSPADEGVLDLIVRRPRVNEREVLDEGMLDLKDGLIGDSWKFRGSSRTPDNSPHPDAQINVMNSRVISLIAQEREHWPLAGDQLFLDLNLGLENLPAGTQLAVGSAIIEVTPLPHTGCQKFIARFGLDAMKFVNSKVGRELCLRGINAKVVQAGAIRTGQVVKKL